MRRWSLFGTLTCIIGLSGCSTYPIPDDVSPFRTEEIVRFGRCEVRQAVLNYMVEHGFLKYGPSIDEIRQKIKTVVAKSELAKKIPNDRSLQLSEPDKDFLRLLKVAVVYSFDFNITENNRAGGGAGARLPGLTNVLDVGGNVLLDRTRIGSRVFGTEDSWDDLIANDRLCSAPWARPTNLIHPLAGSIGVGNVVATFIDIDSQGGAKDNFVDTLIFTTTVSGDVSAGLKLDPFPQQFRPISASAAVAASRIDIHKLTVSLAFPQPDAPKAIKGVTRTDGDLNAPFERPPVWRARYNLCVQDARTRESSFKQLRLTDPIVYCIGYADEFAPEYGRPRRRSIAVSSNAPNVSIRKSNRRTTSDDASPEFPTTPPQIQRVRPNPPQVEQVRPNLRPFYQ